MPWSPTPKAGDSNDGMIEVFLHLEQWQTPTDKAAPAATIARIQEIKAANDSDTRAILKLRREFEAYKKAHP
jgi:hypothetical protein